MRKASRDPEVVACTLGEAQGRSRRQRWLDLAARALLSKSSTERGVRLTFRTAPEVAAELRELAELEADCCAFATWQVTHRREGELSLEVSAEGDGRRAVWAMFDEAPPQLADRRSS